MQKVYSFIDSELTCNILRMCPLKWQDQYNLLEKCFPEGVKPLLLILERIEVENPVHETNAAAKLAKSQGSKQPTKKNNARCTNSKEAQACALRKCTR